MNKRVVLAGRWLFFLASIVFLVDFSRRTIVAGHVATWLHADAFLILIAAAMLYALAALLAAFGWRRLLAALGHSTPTRPTIAIFCITQIAKYLPGNVGHHIGRGALARSRLGVPVATMVISILQESAIACLAAVSIAAACFASVSGPLPSIPDLPASNADWLLIPALGGAWFMFVNGRRERLSSITWQPMAWMIKATPTWRAILNSFPYFAVIYVLNGVAIWLVAGAAVDVGSQDFLLLTGAYAISWVIGFVLPGAPGGLGVREAALILLLNGAYPADAVLAFSLASRLATVIADALLFALGHIIMPNQAPANR